ncbi:MAG: phospho-N-acetylmuramoyl-pentapeptide-transferase, partial [bacterium]|nr:phospho-N-acetylmuramoyl-pentapeptide-transferase [bacterium]
MNDSVFTVFNVVRIFAVSALSFFVALAITPLWTKVLYKYKLGKQLRSKEQAPVFHSLHKNKEGTPTMGGVIIWGTVIIVSLVFWGLSEIYDHEWSSWNFLSRAQTLLPLGALFIAAIFGLADDMLGVFKIGPRGGGLTMKHRIASYTLVAAGGAWWFFYKLGFDFINIPFLGDFTVGWWYIPIFIFIIVASAFSANETDGLDGLAAGTFLTMFAAYGAIAFVQERMDLVVFIGAIMGALVAFLWYNIFPAKFFMGDTGSMSLGIVLGVIAMLTNTPLLLPIIAIIFVGESGSVIIQLTSKRLRGKKIFHSTPIHHHF